MFSTSNSKPYQCSKGCDVALASYYLWTGVNLTFISENFNAQIPTILSYNPQISNQDLILAGTRARIPFCCDCINGEFLGHVFKYNVRPRNTYDTVAQLYYSNLTTVSWLQRFNSYPPERIPDTNAVLNVTVNCSCGDAKVSQEYGSFITYPLRPGETLASVASSSGLDPQTVQDYNPNASFSSGSGLVYMPAKDQSGAFPPPKLSKGSSGGVIAGISVAVVMVVGLLVAIFMCVLSRRKKMRKGAMLKVPTEAYFSQDDRGTGSSRSRSLESAAVVDGGSPRLAGITVDKSVDFHMKSLLRLQMISV